ncbi:hypothetical protein KSF_011580 [Reticulibacter mediterranei]|uniref:Uncharacterized protein n=1 Tax=Reticulibacter mediterranei TaxID=2778369 RepID=A0A8J3IHZ6_9CHLR|nr:hypothetical protein [Reticulibacter mediterranei]GHO91110.1 hypothetical protein KSF_011580 [Reticulibacter mediterranei]
MHCELAIMTPSAVTIQITPTSVPSMPTFLGEEVCSGWSSTWIGLDKRLANEHYRKRMPCLLSIAGLSRSARRAIRAASGEKLSARTRTVILQAHTQQFLGTFGAPGNGDYRGDLRRATQVITSYAANLKLLPASVLLRLDGLYGDAAPLLDVLTAGLGVLARSRAYHLLDLEVVKQAQARVPVQFSTHPESGMTRAIVHTVLVSSP